jgi:hypothetical protein
MAYHDTWTHAWRQLLHLEPHRPEYYAFRASPIRLKILGLAFGVCSIAGSLAVAGMLMYAGLSVVSSVVAVIR